MQYRPLGKSGLMVSEIAFGTGDNAGLMVKGSEREQREAVARALELGITYFDTSPDYGKGAAEVNLGRALRELGAKPLIATKVEVMPEDLDDIEGKVARSLAGSLERLGMDGVDVLMIHNPPRRARNPAIRTWTPLTPDDYFGPALRALEAARRAGKVAHFGFACEGSEPEAVFPLLDSGRFAAINVWYNLVNPTSGMTMPAGFCFADDYDDYSGILTRAGAAGVGAAIIRPLAGGALAPSVVAGGVTARHPNAGGMYSRVPESFAPEANRGRAFRFLHRPDRTLPQAAYAFILANPSVSTVVAGPSDREQLEELAACSGAPPLSSDELAGIRAVYAHTFQLEN